jgi:hypothetical protein
MKKSKLILFIATLFVVSASSYAKSSKNDSSIDPSSLKIGIGSSAGEFVTCLHQRTYTNERGEIVTTPIYAYAEGPSTEPCPKFSKAFEHPANIWIVNDPNEIEWGVYSIPTLDPTVHAHCDTNKKKIIKKPCPPNGQCELPSGCTDYESSTMEYTGTTNSSIDFFKNKPGTTRFDDPEEHCVVAHGNPL